MCEVYTRKLNNDSGFTLVELMIATFLFSIALLSIASLASVVINGNNISKQMTTATMLAQQKMEECIIKGYNGCTTSIEPYDTLKAIDDTTILYSGYQRETTIVPNADNTMKTISVAIKRRNNKVAASLSTIIAK